MTARTPSAVAALPIARRSGSVLSAVTAALLLAGIALAAPAAAVDDPAMPDARVTHGPSCHPGGVVVEVTGGTVGWAVTFATTRSPEGEDSAEVPPGTTVVLRTGGVAWGETIDGRLEYARLDGSGDAIVDELEGYTFTRPAEEDCAAIAGPAAVATVPPVGPAPAAVPDDAVEGAATVDDAAASPAAAAPGKAEAPGAAPEVELVEAAAAPAALPARGSSTAFLAAAVALGAAAAGLVSGVGRSRRAVRPPTRGA